jgi:hypothetical protein
MHPPAPTIKHASKIFEADFALLFSVIGFIASIHVQDEHCPIQESSLRFGCGGVLTL